MTKRRANRAAKSMALDDSLSRSEVQAIQAAEELLVKEFSSVADSASTRDGDDDDQRHAMLLQSYIDANHITCRTPVYQQFMRDPEGGKQDAYRNASKKKRAEVMKSWLELKLAQALLKATQGLFASFFPFYRFLTPLLNSLSQTAFSHQRKVII